MGREGEGRGEVERVGSKFYGNTSLIWHVNEHNETVYTCSITHSPLYFLAMP